MLTLKNVMQAFLKGAHLTRPKGIIGCDECDNRLKVLEDGVLCFVECVGLNPLVTGYNPFVLIANLWLYVVGLSRLQRHERLYFLEDGGMFSFGACRHFRAHQGLFFDVRRYGKRLSAIGYIRLDVLRRRVVRQLVVDLNVRTDVDLRDWAVAAVAE